MNTKTLRRIKADFLLTKSPLGELVKAISRLSQGNDSNLAVLFLGGVMKYKDEGHFVHDMMSEKKDVPVYKGMWLTIAIYVVLAICVLVALMK